MELNEAKRLFDEGVLTRAAVVRAPLENGYHLMLFRSGKRDPGEPIERQRGGYRSWNSIDAAVSVAHEIGFRQIAVLFEGAII